MTVSVIIPAYLSHATIVDTLSAVGAQLDGDGEIIVVDSSPDERTAELVGAAGVARLVRPGERLWPFDARNRGVDAASGSTLVFTDPDCRPRDGWLVALVGALEDGADVAFGPTSSERGAGWRARGVHRAKYSMWCSSAAPARGATAIPSSNVALDRAAWARIGGFASDRWHADTLLGWRAAELGLNVAFVPGAVVEHVAEPDLGRFVRERRERGRTFAAMRAARSGWSRPVALARALSAPLVPAVLLARSLRQSARADELADALRTAPILVLGFGAWALGEARALASHRPS